MSFYKKIYFDQQTAVYLWKIEESFDELLEGMRLKEATKERLMGMKSKSHQLGFLGVRKILEHLNYSDLDLMYSPSGKPMLTDGTPISITHSFEFSAIAIGPQTVGIDMEMQRSKISRIASKFAKEVFCYHENDANLESALLTVVWGAKEAIFKIMDAPGISFLDHIEVKAFDLNSGKTTAVLHWEGRDTIFDISFEQIENYFLVYALKQEL